MAKFVLAYHGSGDMPQSEEEVAKVMAEWGEWFGVLGESLVDGGNPFAGAKTVGSDGSVTDGGGPAALTGYSIITADSIDAAVTAAKGCPVLGGGGSVEVCEAIDM